jgi:hypothetical protein
MQQQQQQSSSLPPISARAESQRRINVPREVERMKHVLMRLSAQEARASKRAQIIELRAREVEGVRHESERDIRVREQLQIERRDESERQRHRVAAVREERRSRAESSRRDLRQHNTEMARLTKEQHKLISETLCESNAEIHDRCVRQHAAIRAKERDSHSARTAAVVRKRDAIASQQQQAASEVQQQHELLRLLEQRAKDMEQRVANSKTVEGAAGQRLRAICLTNKNHASASGGQSPNAESPMSSSARGGGAAASGNGADGSWIPPPSSSSPSP